MEGTLKDQIESVVKEYEGQITKEEEDIEKLKTGISNARKEFGEMVDAVIRPVLEESSGVLDSMGMRCEVVSNLEEERQEPVISLVIWDRVRGRPARFAINKEYSLTVSFVPNLSDKTMRMHQNTAGSPRGGYAGPIGQPQPFSQLTREVVEESLLTFLKRALLRR